MSTAPALSVCAAPAGKKRYVILSLVFLLIVVLYLDRTILSVLNPEFSKPEVYGSWWNAESFGDINAAFMLAYACGFGLAGKFFGKFGLKVGYALAIALWAVSAAGHALAESVTGFMIARAFLGIGEAGGFPGAIRTVAEWFPRKERAFATGLFNAGSNIGSFLAPTLIPWLYLVFGWRSCFLLAGGLGLLWVVAWLVFFRTTDRHPGLTDEERAYINSDKDNGPVIAVPAASVLRSRQFLAFASGKLLTDPIWFFLLFWTPKILSDKFHTNIKQNGLPLVIIAAMAVAGGIAGGWASSKLLARGKSANFARKVVMLGCALCVLPMVVVPSLAASETNKWIERKGLGNSHQRHVSRPQTHPARLPLVLGSPA